MAADDGSVFVYDDGVNVAKFFQAALDVLELGVSRLEFLAGVIVCWVNRGQRSSLSDELVFCLSHSCTTLLRAFPFLSVFP